MRNCPIDCASIYYNGVRRSGLYTVVPSLAGMPIEVYCDMDTDGESHRCINGKFVDTICFIRLNATNPGVLHHLFSSIRQTGKSIRHAIRFHFYGFIFIFLPQVVAGL